MAGSKRKDTFQPYEKKAGAPGDSRSFPPKTHNHADALRTLSIHLTSYYAKCTSDFKYKAGTAPRRVLTKVADGIHNGGYDNVEHDYICRVNDVIENPDGIQYEIAERLGHGTFGQVLKCQVEHKEAVAVKIIKNKPAYFHQAIVEVKVLQTLNQRYNDIHGQDHIVRMLDFFVYRRHLCIVFELLSVNLYEVLKQNAFRGLSTTLIRTLMEQLLKALGLLRRAKVIHCDLKPENVLLSTTRTTQIKLIDFGSACFEQHTVYTYIQSRFYRSPEVLLGLSYTSAIDMWSLGCIAAELYLGLPIFPGNSEFDQMCRIVEVLGLPPRPMLVAGRTTRKFFRLATPPPAGELPLNVPDGGEEAAGPGAPGAPGGGGRDSEGPEQDDRVSPRRLPSHGAPSSVSGSGTPYETYDLEDFESASATTGSVLGEPWAEMDDIHRPPTPTRPAAGPNARKKDTAAFRLKSKEEYERDAHKTETASKKYVRFSSLEEMLEQVAFKPAPKKSIAEEQNRRKSFLHFLRGVLHFEPHLRWTPEQADQHPFIAGKDFDPAFAPNPNEPPNEDLVRGGRIDPGVPPGAGPVQDPGPALTPARPPTPSRTHSTNSHGTPGLHANWGDAPGHSSAPGSRRASPAAKSGAQLASSWNAGPPGPQKAGPPGWRPGPYPALPGGMSPSQGGQPQGMSPAGGPRTSPGGVSRSGGLSPGGSGQPGAGMSPAHGTGMSPGGMAPVVGPRSPGHFAGPAAGFDPGSVAGIPLPEEDAPVSYRPPIHLLPDEYFRGFTHGRYHVNTRAQLPLGVSPPSSYSSKPSASAFGMAGGRGGGYGGKGRGSASKKNFPPGAQNRPRSWGGDSGPGSMTPTWGPPSPVHKTEGSLMPVGTPPGPSPVTAGSPLGAGAQQVHHEQQRPSRGNSPWHLPSPMSPLSTTSSENRGDRSHKTSRDRVSPFSQHSTCSSESYDEVYTDEDPGAHLDVGRRSGHTTDSDTGGTPRGGHHPGDDDDGPTLRDARLLEHIKNTISGMCHNSIQRRHASPGSSQGAPGGHASQNFREATGMGSSGPVPVVPPTGMGSSGPVPEVSPEVLGFHPKPRSRRGARQAPPKSRSKPPGSQ